MEIIEVKQNWPNGYFRIDFTIGNICNYKCWYCFPGSNEGNYKWPDYDLTVKNLSHLLDYYIKNTNKKKFEINILGGEVTHWKKVIPFVEHFKNNYNCVFSLITNGSKKIDWWKENGKYFDRVTLSHHQEWCNPQHLRDVADLLYESNVLVNITMIMDPKLWDGCLESIEYYKKSRKQWSIRMHEALQDEVAYTEDQLKLISKLRARSANLFYFFRINKMYRSSVTVTDIDKKKHKISDNYILHNRLNSFYDWECNLGVDWVSIRTNGDIFGTCQNKLYNSNISYNLYDEDFVEKFQPTIVPTICEQKGCWCGAEINMSKKKILGIENKKDES
jgi:sulfatase maturation enzyme AslB (radical SAM superfamily)